ncbi:MAG: cytochrome c3 family protein [Eggerthellales bacterium]|nr:cytochrome c3 family protein [Eggerthellales bacterium]
MKKTALLKIGIVAAAITSLGLFALAGCTPATEDSGNNGAASTSYAEHEANCVDGDGIASFHAALGYECTACHGEDLDAQVAELGVEGEPALTSTYYTATETCLQSDCHNSWETLAERTADLGDYNPHDSIHGTIEDCNECHKGHSTQVDICGECHPNGGQEMVA